MPLAPDAGMSQLAADLARRSQDTAAEAADPGEAGAGGGGLDLELFARLAVALGQNTEELRQHRVHPSIPWEVCHPAPLNPITGTVAGAVNDERWEPRQGWFWHITRISVQSNAAGGATSALAVLDSVNTQGAGNLQQFPPAGSTATAGSFLGCWEPKGLFIGAGTRLLIQGVAGGCIANGQAVEIRADWLPTYLM